jgi:hypothetical protein
LFTYPLMKESLDLEHWLNNGPKTSRFLRIQAKKTINVEKETWCKLNKTEKLRDLQKKMKEFFYRDSQQVPDNRAKNLTHTQVYGYVVVIKRVLNPQGVENLRLCFSLKYTIKKRF